LDVACKSPKGAINFVVERNGELFMRIENETSYRINKNQNIQSNNTSLKLQEQKKSDVFAKNSILKEKRSPLLIFFQGKFEKIAKNIGKGLFTRGNNCYKKAFDFMKQNPNPDDKEFQKHFSKPMQEALNCFEGSLPKLRAVLTDEEYAMKANYVGTVYTYVGNVTRNLIYYSRAHDLFDEAAAIVTRLSVKNQQNLNMFTLNKQSVNNILYPASKKNPIGFRYPENKPQE
jgi:hypothetical protein